MIPQSTTLQERLEFYEWALKRLKRLKYEYVCILADEFFLQKKNLETDFRIQNMKVIFPELYELRTLEFGVLWESRKQRIEALQKSIIEVKRKIEEDGKGL